MARLITAGDTLVVQLSPIEKLAAFHGNVRVPLRTVCSIEVVAHPWPALRGARAPGTGFPGWIAYGVRRHQGGRDFAAVLGGRQAVRIDLDSSSPFGRLVVSARDAEAVAGTVRAATERTQAGR